MSGVMQLLQILESRLSIIRFIASMFLLFGLFECFYAAEKGQKFVKRLKNFGYAFLSFTVGTVLILLINEHFYPKDPLVTPTAWYSILPVVILVLFLGDLLSYFYHRAEHKFAILWKIHKLHHTDDALNVSSSMRVHVLEMPLQHALITLPIAYLFGLDAQSAAMTATIMNLWLFFIHANLEIHFDWISRIVVGPQQHRIHHSRLEQHRDKNFASRFSFIDVFFGTYYHPSENEYPPTGA